MAYAAGEAIAKFSSDPNAWAPRIDSAVAAIPEGERNFSLVAGFYLGLNAADPVSVETFKRMAAMSQDFGPAFPLLTSALGITNKDMLLECEALRAGTVLPGQMVNWTFGDVLAKLAAADVAPLFDQLLSMDGIAYSVALDLMGMYVLDAVHRL